jgi:hypothetical protein
VEFRHAQGFFASLRFDDNKARLTQNFGARIAARQIVVDVKGLLAPPI